MLDTNIGDPTKSMEQRILERRAAIDAKLRQKRAQASGAASAALAAKEREEAEAERIRQYGRGDEQVRASRRELSSVKVKAMEQITAFRIATEDTENQRRQQEEALVEARRQQVKDDTDSARTVQGAIQMNFDSLFDSNPQRPRELAEELTKQKDACNRVLEIKDMLAAELKLQLQAKEESYVVALKTQASDVDKLLETMREQTRTLMESFSREFNSVQAAFMQERAELLTAHDSEMDSLVKQRTDLEKVNRNKREAKVWEDQRVLYDKYEEHAEKFARIKMDFLKDIHELEQELARIRAKYMLGDAKLKYNLKVLNDRNKENKKAAHLHRTKVTKLRSILSAVHAKYAETEKRFRHKNNELTEAFRRVTEQYKDLQVKFQHFERADVEKRQQIWTMHEEECMSRVHRCLQGDRVVFEEVLGVAWATPDLDFWDAEKEAIEERQRMLDEAAKAEAEGKAAAAEGEKATDKGGLTSDLSDAARLMLNICYSQLKYCLDERLNRTIEELSLVDGEEETVAQIKMETVLDALGITKTSEVMSMLDYFIVRQQPQDGTSSGADASGDSSGVMIGQEEALHVLHLYLTERKEKEAAAAREAARDGATAAIPSLDLGATAASGGASPGSAAASAAAARTALLSGSTMSEARREELKQRARERNFWYKMSNVISPEHLRVWHSVEGGLNKYLRQLQIRQKLIEETDGIRRQNDELRSLLNQYLSNPVNDELFAPPQLQVVGAGQ